MVIEKLFCRHPNENGKSWLQHMLFAVGISTKLSLSSFFFLLHGFVPFIPTPTSYNLEAMISYLTERNSKAQLKKD